MMKEANSTHASLLNSLLVQPKQIEKKNLFICLSSVSVGCVSVCHRAHVEFRGQLLGVGSLPYGTEDRPQVVRSVHKQKSALCIPVNRSFLAVLITSVERREAIYPVLNR